MIVCAHKGQPPPQRAARKQHKHGSSISTMLVWYAEGPISIDRPILKGNARTQRKKIVEEKAHQLIDPTTRDLGTHRSKPAANRILGKTRVVSLLFECPVPPLLKPRPTPDTSCCFKQMTSYRIRHLDFFPSPWCLPFFDSNAERVACSKTSLTPSFVFAEHSR